MNAKDGGAAIAPDPGDSLLSGGLKTPDQPHNRGSTGPAPGVNLNFATRISPEIEEAVRELFEYAPWTTSQVAAGREVREALAAAYLVVIDSVPPCPTRTIALRKIVEARMDCNAAITHRGRF